MFLDGQKLCPYIPMAKARGFTGTVDKSDFEGGKKMYFFKRNFFVLFSVSVIGFCTLFLALDAQKSSPEEQSAREAIESASNFDDVQTKETERYFMDTRLLDDGNKEVRIRMKSSGPKAIHTYYFVVHGKDFSYHEVLPSQTGFPKD